MDFNTITPCGENCAGCKKKADGFCRGCIESGGHCEEWKQSKGCPIFLCAQKHSVKFCGLCSEFPCDFMVKTISWRTNAVEELRALAEQYHSH